MAMTKVKNLQLWCKKMCDGYRDVEVRDMAASWKSGLAFCAIIHRFRPDLIDYDSLAKENVFDNNQLAFEVAEKQLQIPAFLEAADMVAIRVPDRLSVVTYVSQYYNYFHNKPQLGGPGVSKFVSPAKRKDNKPADKKSLTPAQNKTENKEIKKDRQESMGDKCSICHEKVYLMERQIENAKLYHRRCFRESEMSPTSKVLKRQPYSTIEETNESQSSKFRKTNKDTKLDTSKQSDSKFDVLKKHSEVKDISGKAAIDDKKLNFSSNAATVSTDLPSWKTTDKSKEFSNEKGPAFQKTDVKDRYGGTASKAQETKPASGHLVNKFKELDERNRKALEDKSFPVPKPRHNLGKTFEKMDTSESSVHPTPTPRNQKTNNPFVSGATSKDVEVKNKSPTFLRKTDFSRPKTPPNQNSEFSLNLNKHKSTFNRDDSSSSPPPLPPSSPPKLPASQPPAISTNHSSKLDFNRSPISSPRMDTNKSSAISPRTNEKFNKTETKNIPGPGNAPLKPPRLADCSNTDRSSKPMDTSEVPVPSKAIVHEPSAAQSAVLVVPNRHNPREEEKNREVLGGLLKSLAGVRQKQTTNFKSTVTIDENKGVDSKKTDFNVALRDKDKGVSGVKDVKPRPKTSFVSQNRDMFSDSNKKESQDKGKVVTSKKTVITTITKTTSGDNKTKHKEVVLEQSNISNKTGDKINTDSDIPEWKRKLEENKRSRPKSADLLSDKNTNNSGSMLDWQKEAAKRKEARKGGYVDPEKGKLPNTNANSLLDDNSKLSRPLSPPQRKSVEVLDDKTHKATNGFRDKVDNTKKGDKDKVATDKVVEPVKKKIPFGFEPSNEKPTEDANKKKIGLGQKFVFEDVELKPAASKPARPSVPPASPTSPRLAPSRPPPPKTTHVPVAKNHISTYQIQKQLRVIDEKLTQLELKGRSLEVSIRNANDEEEDDLMIKWFELVNDKNELVRSECDLVYKSRQQELELEQDRVEQQLRNLVDKPDHLKTEEDLKEETLLMEKKVDLVYQRNNIVDSIDEDRLRYLEEDKDIEEMLQKKGFLKDGKDGNVQKKKDKKKK